jgi:hypothetical protein
MNDHDKSNLDFIRSLSEEAFDEWSASLSEDDVEYALELLRTARSELAVMHAEIFDELEDTTQAQQVLKKFML